MNVVELFESFNIVEIVVTSFITVTFWLITMVVASAIYAFLIRRRDDEHNDILQEHYNMDEGHHDNIMHIINEAQENLEVIPIEYNPENNINLVTDLLREKLMIFLRDGDLDINEIIKLNLGYRLLHPLDFTKYRYLYRHINVLCHQEEDIDIVFESTSWTVMIDGVPLFTQELEPTSIRFHNNDRSVFLNIGFKKYYIDISFDDNTDFRGISMLR